MLKPVERGFFVGYFKKVPADIGALMINFIVFFVAGMASSSVLLSINTEKPGSRKLCRRGFTANTRSGTMETSPYPVLQVPATGSKPTRHHVGRVR